jgi:hypothetical protein
MRRGSVGCASGKRRVARSAIRHNYGVIHMGVIPHGHACLAKRVHQHYNDFEFRR